ncbi:MAG: Mini-ribonuclease 3 [Firmicutes bacterium]|nr:Mini-ribonuclease 3 [Bacillota bacterium]
MFGVLKNHNVPEDPARMNEIVLAYLGDCVYELYVRNLSVETGEPKVYVLNKMSSARSKASYQAAAVKKILPSLSETEAGIVRRAKNKKITSKPKNADPMDYKAATAFEALVGYLYLTEQTERMEHIIGLALNEYESDVEIKDKVGEQNE